MPPRVSIKPVIDTAPAVVPALMSTAPPAVSATLVVIVVALKLFEVDVSESALSAALKRERQLKPWSRAKKEALVAGDLALLKGL